MSVQKPHSCKHCQKLLFKPLPRDLYDFRPRNYEFDFSLADIIQAAAEQCSLCQWFLDDIIHSPRWQNFAEKPETHDKLKLCTSYSGFNGSAISRIWSFGLGDLWSTPNGFEVCTPSGELVCLRLPHMTAQAALPTSKCVDVYLILIDNVASCVVTTRPIYRDVGSEHHFSLARNWLKECVTTHTECPKPTNSFMPTRLIEITKFGTNWNLRLHYSDSTIVEPYVALSYCWGGDQVIKTTKLTIKEWRNSLSFEILPKTLQDAIAVTSKLNTRYLWVDALCIIQDDAADMAKEISQMALIYNSALVTITASRARTVNEGFLQVRDAGDPPHLIFELPYETEKGELGSVTLLCPSRRHARDGVSKCEPLDVRAWAFQERLLSPRLLDYRSLQLRWECRRDTFHNGRYHSYADGWERDQAHHIPYNLRSWLFDPGDSAALMQTFPKEWSSIVESYSGCSLTFHSDKLPALSAAAEMFGSRLHDSYIAGMWKNTLLFNLSWYRKHEFYAPLMARPRVYQAPSWSWASINESVIMFAPAHYRTKHSRYILQILHYDVQLADVKAPYGAVISGFLTVKGRIKKIEPISNANITKMDYDSMAIKVGGRCGTNSNLSRRTPEDGLVQDGRERTPIFALEIFMYCSEWARPQKMGHEGLLLCKLQGRNDQSVYRRVGYFVTRQDCVIQWLPGEDEESWRLRNFEHLKLFDDCEPQAITII